MATVTTTRLVDDLDGQSDAAETVSFALDGVSFEIDLTEANAAELREVLAKYTEKGRRTGGRVQRGRQAGSQSVRSTSGVTDAQKRAQTKEIRAWARANGHPDIPDRGRIAMAIVHAYMNRDVKSNVTVKKPVIMEESVGEKPVVSATNGSAAQNVRNVRGRSTSRRPSTKTVAKA